MTLRRSEVSANGVSFALLEDGPEDAPLALCLHGYPDTAWTWRHLLPALADAGRRGVAPFMRGYAPTSVPADGRYQTGALAADANALHEALGGDGEAVLIGHDWGAAAAYGAAAHEPRRWRRLVTLAVPPAVALAPGFTRVEQLKRSWYMFFQLTPLAEHVIPLEDFAFLRALWEDWSPGYDAGEDVARVAQALGEPANLSAALGYYRAQFGVLEHDPALASEQAASAMVPPQPTLYMHGRRDGCIGADLADDLLAHLAAGSHVEVLEGCGHFLHLERPADVGARVLDFIG
jgi:pimeloyl-ACP methyl ester carboxylesterase